LKKRKQKMCRYLIFICSLTLATPFLTLHAQVIEGTVLDEKRQALQDVHISVEQTDQTDVTDSDGRFMIHLIGQAEGVVNLTITSVGYQSAILAIDLDTIGNDHLEIILKETVYQSQTVVVTATRTRRDIEEVSIPVSVISGEQIRRSGSMRLSDVLSEQTGMQIVNDHGTGIQVQGFDPDYTMIMIDGSPVIGRTAGTLDLTRITVRNVEQIEIVKGPSSALWGSDALAGVINIITQSSKDEFSGRITTHYGENNTLDLSSDLSLNTGDFKNNLFLNRNSSGGYRLNPASISQTVPEYQNYTLGYRGSLKISDQLQLSGNVRWFTEYQQNRSTITVQDGDTQLLNSEAGRTDFMARSEINYSPTNRFDVNLNWYTSYYKTESELVFSESGEQFTTTQFNQFYNKPEIQAGYRWDNHHHSVLGAGAIFERLDAERYPGQPNFTTQFLFAQHSWIPSLNFEIIGGVRYDTHSEYSSQLSPKLSTRYRPAEWVQFRASAGRGFKAPEFRQLFLDFTNATGGYSVFGSSTVAEGIVRQMEEGTIERILIPVERLDEIRAESSWAVNAGFDLDPVDNVRLRVNMFRNNVTDLIETAPIARRTNGQAVFTYFNVDEVYTQGAETELRIRFSNRLQGSVGYQLLDARRKIKRDRTVQDDQGEVVQRTDISFEPMFNRSRHSGNIRIFYESESGWGANLRGTLRGRYGLFDQNGNGFVNPDEYEPGYTIWNVAVSRNIGEMITLQAGAVNLHNYTNINQPYLAGRLFFGQLSIHF
jgi:outer membrane receptor for ferrienterochelin and colicins